MKYRFIRSIIRWHISTAVLYLGVRRLALRYTTFTCNICVTRIPKHATRINREICQKNISSNSFKRKRAI